MAKYQKYAEYKDSGIEWLGEIPAIWKIGALRWKINIASGEGVSSLIISKEQDLANDFPIVGGNGIMGFSNKDNSSHAIAIGRVGALCGNVHLINFKSWISDNALKISKWLDFDENYLVYLLKSAKLNDLASTTAQPLITGEQIKSLKVVIPLINEQTQIANFLDYETAKIDSLIEKQQQLIQLLKEKRQVVISHAVTKGLNPDVPMKDSGVEWLGQVPEHWQIPKLLHITTRIGDGLHSTPTYQDGTGYYFINGNNLVDGEIIIGETAKEVPESEFIKHQVVLDSTTVLVSINGTIGKVALYKNESVILGKSAAYINCHSELFPNFLASYLTTSQARNYYDLDVTGTTIFNLSLNSIRNMKVPLPPLDEQKSIVQFVEEQTRKYENLIQSSEKQNRLLKERRTALISAAVTGKIDVRSWQKPTEAKMESSA